MSKLYLSIVLSFLCTIGIHAQRLSVESFVVKTNDITARTQPRQDINGNDCALVKVQLAASYAVFEGNVIGDVAYNTSEYLVYMAQGSKKLTVKLEGYLPLEIGFQDYDVKSLEPKTVYLLTISGVVNGNEQELVRTKTGWIILDSEPSGASVYINDEFVGNTPLSSYKQAYGTYQYKLESPNYHPATGIIELNAGRYEQKVVLKPAFGSISIKSSIAGANILLDGKQTGKHTPATLSEIASGSHTITLQIDKYAPRQQEVMVEDGQTTNVSMTLDARFARITINSLDGAEIYSNGKLLGKNRISEDMMEGYYDLEARLNHYKSVTKQIQVVAGQAQDITLNPIPKYGSLDVMSTPHNATISIDGKVVGKSPLTIYEILEGEHTVQLTLDNYQSEIQKVTIKEKQAKSLQISLNNSNPPNNCLFGHVNTQEIIQVMPEYNKAKTEIDVLQAQYEADLKSMQDELQKKGEAFEKEQATLPENIKQHRQQELQDMYNIIQQSYQNNQQALTKAAREKMQVITNKVLKAIETIGKEYAFLNIYEYQAEVLVNPKICSDLTQLVKYNLGLGGKKDITLLNRDSYKAGYVNKSDLSSMMGITEQTPSEKKEQTINKIKDAILKVATANDMAFIVDQACGIPFYNKAFLNDVTSQVKNALGFIAGESSDMTKTIKDCPFGHVNTQEIIQVMPEYNKAKTEIDALQVQYETELKSMQDELQRKGEAFDKEEATMSETNKKRCRTELQELYQKITQTYQHNQEVLQKAAREKMQVITNKVLNAINEVGVAGRYAIIHEINSGIPFINSDISIDVTKDVKARLGL